MLRRQPSNKRGATGTDIFEELRRDDYPPLLQPQAFPRSASNEAVNEADKAYDEAPPYEPSFLFWLKRSAIMATPYAAALLFIGVTSAAIGSIALGLSYEHIERDIYMKTHGITNRSDVSQEINEIFSLRRNYLGGSFFLGSLISRITSFFLLNDLAKTLTSPLEAHIAMMGIVGVIFGMIMGLMKTIEAYHTNKKLSAIELFSSFTAGVLAGMGLYMTALIPSMNHAYDGGMSRAAAIVVAGLSQALIFGTTLGAYMYISQREYQKTAPLPTAKTLRMLHMKPTPPKAPTHIATIAAMQPESGKGHLVVLEASQLQRPQ